MKFKICFGLALLLTMFIIHAQDKLDVKEVERPGKIDSIKSLENDLQQFNVDQQQIMEAARAIFKKKQAKTRARSNVQIPNLWKAIKNKKIALEVDKMLKPVREVPEKDLIKLFKNSEGDVVSNFVSKRPKFIKFLVKFVRDRKAPASAAMFLERRQELFYYFCFVICTIILGSVLKHRSYRKNRSFIKSFTFGIMRSFFFNVLRICVFVFIFWGNFSPTLRIIRDVYFS
ncbi:MAG: hypothetical protein KAQ98_12760 [Bacteriovoracaceae bacterium]|nr:hypothetical protein [Bacteriovoracaceae bacterium]